MTEYTEFSIIQYVPDPIANERMNIGVVVLTPSSVRVNFVTSWKRAQTFAQGADISHLRDFKSTLELLSSQAHAMYQKGLPLIGEADRSPQDLIRKMAASWSHQIQFAPFQRSLEDADRLMQRLSGRYLKEGKKQQRMGKSKNDVVSSAVRSLKKAMPEALARDHNVRRWVSAQGDVVPQITLDFGLMNGELKAAGQAVSFQTLDLMEIRHQWKEAVWSLIDLRRLHQELPTSLIIAKPFQNSREYEEEYEMAMDSAVTSGIWLALDTETDAWAHKVTEAIPA
jgi:hypothetical protein